MLLQVLNFLKIFNSLFILLIVLFPVNTFVEISRNSYEYARFYHSFYISFYNFFGIIIHVDSMKRHALLLSMPFTTVYDPLQSSYTYIFHLLFHVLVLQYEADGMYLS